MDRPKYSTKGGRDLMKTIKKCGSKHRRRGLLLSLLCAGVVATFMTGCAEAPYVTAYDILAARADFVSYLFGVFTNRGRADSHGAPAKAPLRGSRSQAILNLLPTQLQLACGKPRHFAVD